MTEQVLKVLSKLDERKYPEYYLGNTRTAKSNKLVFCCSMVNTYRYISLHIVTQCR